MNVPSAFPSGSAVLTTFFYEDEFGGCEFTAREIDGLVFRVKRTDDGRGGYVCEGKIYVFGDGADGLFMLDGDRLGDKTVRKQTISANGFSCTVKKIRRIRSGGSLHHTELEVS